MIIHRPSSRTSRLSLRRLGGPPHERFEAGLRPRLDDGYHFFRSVSAGGSDPIEAIVVGVGGTWAFAFHDATGRFRKRNGYWYRWNPATESWIPWDAAPVIAARLAGHRLSLYLDRAGLPPTVQAALVVARGAELGWERDQRPGIEIGAEDATTIAPRIVRDELLTPAQVDRIVALLDPRQPLTRLATSAPQG